MQRPRNTDQAFNKADTLKRGLKEYQVRQLEKLHKLVLHVFKTTDTKLFAVIGYNPDSLARAGLTLLFRKHAALQLQPYWIAGYLFCSTADAETMENAAIGLIEAQPSGEFAKKLRTICEEVGVELRTIFPH